MKLIAAILGLALAVAGAIHAEPRYVTITVGSTNGSSASTDFSIGNYEVAEVASYPQLINTDYTSLQILKDGHTVSIAYEDYRIRGYAPWQPIIVAGPATFRLWASNGRSSICTLKISPESFPPDRTIIVPPGTNQSRVALQCSTNLIEWFAATNGTYGPLPEAKFFRIKLEPVIP